ncbi:hypothetical protein CC78DRAFT_577178 [Lojkania enalia]|uniref:Uncharacterized protein n=1 Tax=Lojkania enalia TaxID=147567 RepID=A0A9P4KEZ1_9PLEO|nr:hypothetical protein CC78DRAFT_577178 [Didymosphaeria enalia]
MTFRRGIMPIEFFVSFQDRDQFFGSGAAGQNENWGEIIQAGKQFHSSESIILWAYLCHKNDQWYSWKYWTPIGPMAG